MPSPFPGMNPYLERASVWHDFHESVIASCRWALVPQIRPNFIATVDDNIYIEDVETEERELIGRSDESVSKECSFNVNETAAAVIVAPVLGRVAPQVDVLREAFIEIRNRDSLEVVTVIEILSPTNKRMGDDRSKFLDKRYTIMHGNAHYVEIDLLRGGPRLPIENLPDCDAYAMVSRVEDRPTVVLWPVRLCEPLPTIPIPLRAPAKKATLDLQAVLLQTYDASGYADYIYKGEPEPPLSEEEKRWTSDLLATERG